MRKILLTGFLCLAAACLLPLSAQTSTRPAGYHVTAKTPLSDSGSFWDYMLADPAHRHLFISHTDHVLVYDMDQGKIVGSIAPTPGVHGIAIAPELNRGFISNGRGNSVTIFALDSLKNLQTVAVTGKNPDAIIYDPASRRVFTFNGGSSNSTVIDATTGKVVGTITLGGRPEYAVPDGKGHVYNNLESTSEMLEIDSHSLKILHRWPMTPCQSPSGLAMDTAHRRLFAGCHNRMMAVIDADNGKVVTTVPIGSGVDANRFDPGTGLAFSSNGEGTITVVREVTPNQFKVLGNVPTQRGARTMALDTKTHDLYTVTAKFGPMPPRKPGQRFRRPSLVPGSFTLIKVQR